MEKPYIGVTGVTSPEQATDLLRLFEKNNFTLEGSHIPMMGVLVSDKTFNHRLTKSNRYPDFFKVVPILEAAKGRAFTALHYNTHTPEQLADEVEMLFNFGDIYENNLCRGIQLNIKSPPVEQIQMINEQFPDMKIILQMSQTLEELTADNEKWLNALHSMNCADYVLIDSSRGQGRLLDIAQSAELFKYLSEKVGRVCYGFAGGLSGDSVRPVMQRLSAFTGAFNFSLDAEGKLMNENDVLDLEKVEDYISGASREIARL